MIIPVSIAEGRFGAALLCHRELLRRQFLLQLRGIRFFEIVHMFWLIGGNARCLRAGVAHLAIRPAANKAATAIPAILIADICFLTYLV